MDGLESLMSGTIFGVNKAEVNSPIVRVPVLDSKGRAYATGRRKTAVAKVWLIHGKGSIIVNGRSFEDYFTLEALRAIIEIPFVITGTLGVYDVSVTVLGGGIAAQADALKFGISKALCNMDPGYRAALKLEGLLTRDNRIVERKKYGQKKARKSFQFSKR